MFFYQGETSSAASIENFSRRKSSDKPSVGGSRRGSFREDRYRSNMDNLEVDMTGWLHLLLVKFKCSLQNLQYYADVMALNDIIEQADRQSKMSDRQGNCIGTRFF